MELYIGSNGMVRGRRLYAMDIVATENVRLEKDAVTMVKMGWRSIELESECMIHLSGTEAC